MVYSKKRRVQAKAMEKMMTRLCKYCNNVFTPEKSVKGGYSSFEFCCRNCYNKWRKVYAKEYYDTHKEEHKAYYEKNKQYKLKYQNSYREKNKEEINRKKREHYYKNRERINKERREKYLTYRNDIIYKLNRAMGKAFWESLKENKQNIHWEDLIYYSVEDLKKHLESQFDESMTWGNFGSYWEIDHIIPKSQFNYTSPQDKQFKICWSLLNLRPLERIANRSRPKDGRDIPESLKLVILSQTF